MKTEPHKTDGKRIGYARVSTDDQHLDLQLDALQQTGIPREHVYLDKASGKNAEREQLGLCLRALHKGDSLVVWRLDRLGRSLSDLVRIIGELEKRGVSFESLTERIETGSASGRLVFHVFAALSEFERSLIRERTKAGLKAARARGRVGGRKPKLSASQIQEIICMVNARDIPIIRIAELYGVSRTTIYKVIAREQQTAPI